jgi:hypothetical protein
MPEGTQTSPSTEFPSESLEISEAQVELDRAAYKSDEEVELKGDVKRSEDTQKEFEAMVGAAGTGSDNVDLGRETPTEPIPAGEENESLEFSEFREDLSQLSNDLEQYVGTDPEHQSDSSNNLDSSRGDAEGKTAIGSEDSDPGDQNAGVNLAQGEVESDSDWNETKFDSSRSDSFQEATAPTSQTESDSGNSGSEAANNPLLTGQGRKGSAGGLSLDDDVSGSSTDSGESSQGEKADQSSAEMEKSSGEGSGEGDAGSEPVSDLEDYKYPPDGLVDFTSLIESWRRDGIDNSISPEVSELAPESLAQITVGSSSESTDFEDFDQKTNQIYQLLSSILKGINDQESAVTRNML